MTGQIEPGGSENLYSVVINHEGQYSIWPLGREMPGGWQKEGKTGNKNECLEYISGTWNDISPRSIEERNEM